MVSDFVKLRDEHVALAAMFTGLRRAIEQPVPPPQVELFEMRRELASALIAHLKTEDWVLYPRLMNSGDPNIAAVGRAFNEEMGGLADAFVAYSDKWSAVAIAADLAGYCTETRAILDALTNRISRENRDLLPLLQDLEKAA